MGEIVRKNEDVFLQRLRAYKETECQREFRAAGSALRLHALREGRKVVEVHSPEELVEAAKYAPSGAVVIMV